MNFVKESWRKTQNSSKLKIANFVNSSRLKVPISTINHDKKMGIKLQGKKCEYGEMIHRIYSKYVISKLKRNDLYTEKYIFLSEFS